MMDNFKAAADRCVERGDRKTARRILMERKIVFKVVDLALKDGNTVSVFDCEEWTVKRSTNKAEIRAALFTTDDDQIRIRDKDGNSLSWMWFVYGNDGYDVISDYSVSPYNEKLMEVLDPMIEKMELAV